MKRKILLALTLSLLLVAGGLMAKMTTDQANGSVSVPVDRELLHPQYTPSNESIHRTPADPTSHRDAPEPDQESYLIWEDNFEGEDDIYYYGGPTYVWNIPVEADEFGVRFTARRAGALAGAYFYWYTASTDAEAIVHVYEDDGTGYPGTEVGNVTVSVTPGGWNYVDLTSLSHTVNTIDDFFISYSVVAGDTVTVISDAGGTGAHRSVEVLPGSKAWTYAVNDYGVDYEWCMDAIIEVDQGPWSVSHPNTWESVEDSSYSPTHSMWIDDDPANEGENFLISPPFTLPTWLSKLDYTYWYNSELVDADGDGNGTLEDYWYIYIGNTADAIGWHEDEYNAWDDDFSWYAGDEVTHMYGTNAIYYLTSPDIDLTTACAAELTCKIDYDIEAPGGEDPPYDGWDVANVQVSIDGGTSWEFLEDPDYPYNVTIAYAGYWNTHNPADTISYPGWGGNAGGWFDFGVDLTDYVGETINIRYALASDPASTAEGYWVDNIEVTADGTPVFTDTDQANMIPADPIIPLEELGYNYDPSDGWVQGSMFDVTGYAGEEVVLSVAVRLDGNHDGGDGAGFWFDNATILGSNLPPHDMTAVFPVIPYPTTVGHTINPGVVYGNKGTTTEGPDLRVDNLGFSSGVGYDYYLNGAEPPIATGEYYLNWCTPFTAYNIPAGTYDYDAWTEVGGDADASNDTTSITGIVYNEGGTFELGYNSRVWDETYYTSSKCGSYFTPFSDDVLLDYTITSVKTMLINYGATGDEDTETIQIYEAIDDVTPGTLLYEESFSYVGADVNMYEWAEFTLTDPVTVTGDFFVIISGDWVGADPGVGASYFPCFDSMIRQYTGQGAYYDHTVYFADPGYAHSSGDRFVNTVGTGTLVSVDPGNQSSKINHLFPNPVSTDASFSFSLKNPSDVNIAIYNIKGQKVETVQTGSMNAGDHTIEWNNNKLSSGIYFYKIETEKSTITDKMVIIK